jgi:hypothetical protein
MRGRGGAIGAARGVGERAIVVSVTDALPPAIAFYPRFRDSALGSQHTGVFLGKTSFPIFRPGPGAATAITLALAQLCFQFKSHRSMRASVKGRPAWHATLTINRVIGAISSERPTSVITIDVSYRDVDRPTNLCVITSKLDQTSTTQPQPMCSPTPARFATCMTARSKRTDMAFVAGTARRRS